MIKDNKGRGKVTKPIPARKRADSALQRVNRTMRAFFRNCPQAIILLDLNGKVIEWNPAAEHIFGWSKKEVLGKPNPIIPEDKQGEYLKLRSQVEEGRPYAGKKLRRKRKDGTLIYINMSSALIYDEKGKKLAMMGIAEDVTERIATEENNQILAELVDASPASITVHDFEGNFLYANKMTFDLHGFTREEFLSRNLRDIDVPESAERIAQRMKELDERREASFEVFHYRKDGSKFPLAVSAKVGTWNNRRVILSVASDITEKKMAEDATRENEQILQTMIDSAPT